jgi:hypothetical protein
MPFVMQFDIKRAGLAEQFVQNLKGTSEQMLNEVLEGIKTDIASHAPRGSGQNPKAGDVKLSDSFYTIPAQPVGESSWEGYIASTVPAKARAQEYGSGLYGPRMSTYPITPKNAKFLRFEKEGEIKYRRLVNHPGVIGQFYINETLRIWRPASAKKFGDAIRLAAVSRGWMRGLL